MKPVVRKARFSFWVLKEVFHRYFRFLTVGMFVLLIFAVIIFQGIMKYIESTRSTTERIGIVGTYTTSNFPLEIQSLISLGLTQLSESGEATSSLASGWEASESGKLFTFHLKEGIEWHDSKVFNAKNVTYKLKDVEVDSPTLYTMTFRLKDPYAPFPIVLHQPIFKANLVGVGPYKVSRVEFDGQYLSRLLLMQKEKGTDAKLYKFYPTESAAQLALKLGEIDILPNISTPSAFSSWGNLTVEAQPNYNKEVVVFYNTKDNLLSEKSLRQALTYALPDLSNDEIPSKGPFNPLSWAYTDTVKNYTHDIEKAKSLLAKLEKNGSPLEVTLSTIPLYEPLAQRIAASWEEIGVKTTIRIEPLAPQSFQALLIGQILPADPDQYPLWHSTQPTNITGYNNPKIDKLLEDGRKTLHQDERKQIYQEFQKIIVDEAPAAFLYYPKEYKITRKQTNLLSLLRHIF
ncbi:MAG TPA: ABC transporter substrate-binding protein [Patescibacteria group bacterium]|nr:ABC transporter substrate-binding protein [Patescibacteria group bacterium]